MTEDTKKQPQKEVQNSKTMQIQKQSYKPHTLQPKDRQYKTESGTGSTGPKGKK